ncbi:MAG: universal stress protein, partial [Desulfatirhabdiaceae bacterium]
PLNLETGDDEIPLVQAMHRYHAEFLAALGNPDSPYAQERFEKSWVHLKSGSWEEMTVRRGVKKEFKIRIRSGNADTEILNESAQEGSDLIVLGCARNGTWDDASNSPQRVVSYADCSVLLTKGDKPVRRILALIDQTSVSQESLEMINQLITIHSAPLELIGLTKDGGAKPDAYTRLIEIGDYYSDKGISLTTRLEDLNRIESVMATGTGEDLMAFWMGKKSLLTLLFPKDWVEKFVSTCPSSILVLR